MDDHQFKDEELDTVGELPKVCSNIVLYCSYLARISRPDILWSVKYMSRACTKWNEACDKRLVRFISYIHFTHVGADFAGDLKDSEPTTGSMLCILEKPHIRTDKLDLQEANSCFTQKHRRRNYFS